MSDSIGIQNNIAGRDICLAASLQLAQLKYSHLYNSLFEEPHHHLQLSNYYIIVVNWLIMVPISI